MDKVERIAWYAEQAGLTLVSDQPRVDDDGNELWLCAGPDGVPEPYTEMALVESALWQGRMVS